jgi:predicted lactoylglutathione lyase
MPKVSMIFVNLPVKDLPKSRAFYEGLGFSFNPKFSDDTAACLVFSEQIFAMLLTHEKWSQFTRKPIPAPASSEVMIALMMEDKAAVDAMLKAGLAKGGKEMRPAQDLGFMYSRALEDPDGHIWEPLWMDPAAAQ